MNTQQQQRQLKRIATEWLAARDVISNALCEWGMAQAGEAERTAEAIIARLAAHDPPILLEMQDNGPARSI